METVQLPAGTYYIVSEGKIQDLNIITEISTILQGLHPDIDNHNYVLTRTYTEADGSGSRVSIDCFDGLGRSSESILVAASPLEKDIVTRQDYDGFGRPYREWLPRVSEFSNGKPLTPAEFEGSSPGIYDNDACPYSKTVYENSSLNRIVERYGPGTDWYGNNKSVVTACMSNVSGNDTLNCIRYTAGNEIIATDTLVTITHAGNYPDSCLFVTRTTDEDGHAVLEFKDFLERVLLTRQLQKDGNGIVRTFDTYYVYNLRKCQNTVL